MSKIKIIHVMQSLIQGGTENSVLDICSHMNKDDFDITVIALLMGNSIEDHFRAIRGLHIIKLDFRNRFNPLILFQLIRHIRRINPDIIHSHSPYPDIYTRFAALFTTAPSVSTTHNSRFRISFLHIINIITSFLHTKIIANSHFSKKKWVRMWYSSEKKYVVIPLGVDFNKFQPPPRSKKDFMQIHKLQENAMLITSLAFFRPEKGHIYLIKAMQKIIARNPNYYLFLGGDGPMLSYMKAKAVEHCIENNVIFAGRCSNIGEVLSHSDIFVSTSLAETQGLAIAEAMYFKVPVIAFSVDAIPEIVIDNQTGFLIDLQDNDNKEKLIKRFTKKDFRVNMTDVDNLSQKIINVLQMKSTNDERLQTIIDTAYQMVTEIYEISHTVKELEDFYLRLLAEKQ